MATGLTTIVVVIAKFMVGAWVTVLLVATLIWIMHSVRKHYKQVNTEMCDQSALSLDNMEQPIVVIPMARWDKITEKALRFGLLLSKDVKVVHVHSDDAEADTGLESVWENFIRKPIVDKGMTMPELVTISVDLPVCGFAADGLHPEAGGAISRAQGGPRAGAATRSSQATHKRESVGIRKTGNWSPD